MLGLTGRRDQVTDHTGAVTTYGYDDLYRLLDEQISHASLGIINNSYAYGVTGNRTTATEAGITTTYSYDNNDRLAITTSSGVVTSYNYDDNGNTLSQAVNDEVTNYLYNLNNKLTGMNKTVAGSTTADVIYLYDADGNRTQATDNLTISTTKFVVDRNRDYAQVINELDSTDNPAVSYVYGDDLISQSRAANDSFYLYDGHGSTRALSDNTGSITDTYDYSSYGKQLDSSGTTNNSYRYTGEQYDSNLDQYYLRARYYNQDVGRFTQHDTWMGNSHSPITFNKYLYGNADPVNGIDPSGHMTMNGLMAGLSAGAILVGSANAIYSPGRSFQSNPLDSSFSHKQLGALLLTSLIVADKQKKLFCSLFSNVLCAAKGNVADTQIVQDWVNAKDDSFANGNPPPEDRCSWLKENKDKYRADQVRATEKAWGCRPSRLSKDKK